jgi:Arc/MetJ family transcription regulator
VWKLHLGDAVPTNLDIDDRLLNKAKRVGGFRTKKETVTAALEELIAHREQRKVLLAMGTFDFRKDWDYKKNLR